ncbi:MAG: hypothetical protein LC800_01545 [Acidobacteria bacterium]|nr:hypothetical protein [Acidobacteriota bacterium]
MGERSGKGGGPPALVFMINRYGSGEAAGPATWNLELPPRPEPRVVTFSRRRSVGTLYVKPASVFGGPSMLGRKLGPARGKVTVPAGAKLLLEVSENGARDLSPLAGLGPRDLQMVSLMSSGATDDALAHLRGLTWIEWLDLASSNVTGTGLVHLAGMRLLEQLDLWGTDLTAEGLAHLPELPHLRRLTLSLNLELTASGLEHLVGRVPVLEELDVHSNDIGDDAVPHLRRLTCLRELDVRYTGIGRDGVKELQAALPYCRISTH